MPTSLVFLIAAAAPQFEVSVSPDLGEAELARRARIRCGGEATPVGSASDAGPRLTATFTCTQTPGVDVTDALLEAELVVSGKVTAVETPPAKSFGDPTPQWRRATIKVVRVLKGVPAGSARFLFIGSDKDGHEEAPKVKVGQAGVWLLSRGVAGELTMLSSVDSHPPQAEDYLAELLLENPCPTAPVGECAHQGALCVREGVTCTCEAACGGGARPPPGSVRPVGWVCRPSSCSTATEGGKCAPDGIGCQGCWGIKSRTCEKGRWKFHKVSPPP